MSTRASPPPPDGKQRGDDEEHPGHQRSTTAGVEEVERTHIDLSSPSTSASAPITPSHVHTTIQEEEEERRKKGMRREGPGVVESPPSSVPAPVPPPSPLGSVILYDEARDKEVRVIGSLMVVVSFMLLIVVTLTSVAFAVTTFLSAFQCQ